MHFCDDPKITVTGGESEAVNNKWEYYCNQIYEMDQFVKELTETLSKYDEDVVLVMYSGRPTALAGSSDAGSSLMWRTSSCICWGVIKQLKKITVFQ